MWPAKLALFIHVSTKYAETVKKLVYIFKLRPVESQMCVYRVWALKTSCDSSRIFHTRIELSRPPAVTARSRARLSMAVIPSWWPNLPQHKHVCSRLLFFKRGRGPGPTLCIFRGKICKLAKVGEHKLYVKTRFWGNCSFVRKKPLHRPCYKRLKTLVCEFNWFYSSALCQS